MQIFEEDINLKDTQRVVVDIPKQWVEIIDGLCAKSIAPRRTWITTAIHKELKKTGILVDKKPNE